MRNSRFAISSDAGKRYRKPGRVCVCVCVCVELRRPPRRGNFTLHVKIREAAHDLLPASQKREQKPGWTLLRELNYTRPHLHPLERGGFTPERTEFRGFFLFFFHLFSFSISFFFFRRSLRWHALAKRLLKSGTVASIACEFASETS